MRVLGDNLLPQVADSMAWASLSALLYRLETVLLCQPLSGERVNPEDDTSVPLDGMNRDRAG